MQAALEKITSHISNPKKFKKASPLLRQLLTEDAITKAHSNLLFEVPASPTIPGICLLQSVYCSFYCTESADLICFHSLLRP